ncbi:Lrp/AsnC family transcriptional regulator [Streptomyces sp. NPDC102360]|uniref:Lrp/AsnC family transcriptional regulator n=1 Tax=Streptomyces sp. NPDC102360 TaxID=3366160 RepID=UPI003810EF31
MYDGLTQDSPAPLSERDFALINCLEVSPRATWRQIGEVLGLDPVTVARRWQRLERSGAAWVTGRPADRFAPGACLAVLEVRCPAGAVAEVWQALAARPHVLSVEHTSGDWDLTATLALPSAAALSPYLERVVGRTAGVNDVRCQLVTRVHTEGDLWQLRVLDADQRRALAVPAAVAGARRARPTGPDATDRRLILALGRDGRAPLSALAAETGLAVSTVGRRIAALLEREELSLRCDVATPLSGWPVNAWVWARIAPDDTATPAALVRRLPGLRVCLRLSGGSANLLLGLSARSLVELPVVEAELAKAAAGLTVLREAMVLRFVKRMGRLLDERGHSRGAVPMDVWSDPSA